MTNELKTKQKTGCRRDAAMPSSRALLLSIFALIPMGNTETECSELFTNIGNSAVLYVNEKLVYTDAERRCREKGSTLAEIWSEEEWKEVLQLHVLGGAATCSEGFCDVFSLSSPCSMAAAV